MNRCSCKEHARRRVRRISLGIVGGLAFALCQPILAQNEANQGTDGKPNESVVGPIHRLTASARTLNDYTAIIDRCTKTMDQPDLRMPDRDYLKKLASWAYNRRCESRMEAAEYFHDSGLKAQAATTADEALSDVINALELDPSRWRALVNRGMLLAQAGMLDDALADFEQVTEVQPTATLGWYNAAEAYAGMNRHAESIACYDRALAIDAGDLQSLTGRGLAKLRVLQASEALRDFELVLKLMPTCAAALVNRGDAYQALGEWRKAYDDYAAAAELDGSSPADVRGAWLLATCPEAEFYRPQTAKELALKAIDRSGPDVAALEALAAACAALGEFETAVEKQQQAVLLADEMQTATCRERLRLYENQRTYKQSPPVSPSNESLSQSE